MRKGASLKQEILHGPSTHFSIQKSTPLREHVVGTTFWQQETLCMGNKLL